MMLPIADLKARAQESVSNLFVAGNDSQKPADLALLKSSDDEGVQRNGGRRGAEFAPQVLENVFKKMSLQLNTFKLLSL
jgi:hypothetical protein